MRFSKWHALGNTYLLVERADLETPLEPEQVRRLCDAHRGVGADGILEIVEIRGAEAEVVGERIEITPVSVGNPHAVIRRDPSREELLRIGPQVETHERFPSRTNVQLVRAVSPNDLAVRVWEGGGGETLASGSSAAAAAAAAVTHGWCETPVRVHLPGGTLTVDIREGRAVLSGPAGEIFPGENTNDLARR